MSYKLYTDKQENFECQIYLEGTSLSKAKARLVVESNNLNLMFNGKIDKDGKCQIPIKKLRGFLEENDRGNIKFNPPLSTTSRALALESEVPSK